MNCRTTRRRLLRYQDGELPSAERLEIERHLQDCRACAREHAKLARVIGLVESLAEVAPPRDFTTNVLRALAGKAQVTAAPIPIASRFAAGALLGSAGLVLSALIVGALVMLVVGDSAAIGPVAVAAAKVIALVLEVGSVSAEALALALARPVLWLLIADIALLLLVVAGRRRLLAVWRRQGVGSVLTA
jgi:anti-sigma factor RsiW